MKKDRAIPEEFRPCFWDVKFEDLDLEANKPFIISRLYVKGGIRGICWVHETYSDEEVIEAAKCRRSLNPIVANYLRQKYDLKREDMAYYRTDAVGGRELWDYRCT